MRRTGRRDTAAELRLRRELHGRGLRFFVDRSVPEADPRRRVDIVFPGKRVAIFVDGCFWHGCPEHASWPKANAEWWQAKIETNRARDRDTDRRLRDAGWTVFRVWEHESPADAASQIELLLRRAVSQARKTASSDSSSEAR